MSDNDWLITYDSFEHRAEIGAGYRLGWTVSPDGQAWPLLVDERVTGPTHVPCTPAHFADLAPHEQTGRLPAPWRPLCGAPTSTTGGPCKVPVRLIGDRCRRHLDHDRAGAYDSGDRLDQAGADLDGQGVLDLDPDPTDQAAERGRKGATS